jgi:hypothetical protein
MNDSQDALKDEGVGLSGLIRSGARLSSTAAICRARVYLGDNEAATCCNRHGTEQPAASKEKPLWNAVGIQWKPAVTGKIIYSLTHI